MRKRLRLSRDARRKARWLRIAWKAVAAGEKKALASFTYRKTNGYSYKKHREIVTSADLETNRAIIRVLKNRTPSTPIVSEEGGDIPESDLRKTELAWVLDPIDGTTNYTARIPLWGISLALMHFGKPIVGAISLPSLGHLYHAAEGEGAWMGEHRLRVSKTKKLGNSLGLMCYGYLGTQISTGQKMINRFSKLVRAERVLGAAVVESTWVASGRADFSVLDGVHAWDVAAGALFVREAGGLALNLKGRDWMPGESVVIFTNPEVAKDVLRIARS